jgi:hypothetical protein
MKRIILLVLVILSIAISTAKSQIFILGDATYPSVGAMVHFQTMDAPQMGFYNFATYGNSQNKDQQSITLGAGLTYYIAKKHQRPDPQDCLRFYAGFNYNVFWRDDEILFPAGTYEISFDLGISRTFERFTILILADPLNVSVRPGISYYF